MKEYEEKEVKWLISKPRGLILIRRRRSLRRAGGDPHYHPVDNNNKKIPNSTHYEYP